LSLAAGFSAPASALPFEPGEQIRMNVTYLSFDVGDVEANIQGEGVDGGARVWPIEIHGRTHGFMGAFYRLDDTLSTHFDPLSKVTTYTELHENKGDTHNTEIVRWQGAKAQVHRVSNGTPMDVDLDVEPGTLDLLAAVYALRDRSLSGVRPIRIPLLAGRKTSEMIATVAGTERVTTEAGTYDTIVVRCRTMFGGKFASSRELTIWLSNDDRRIPVRFEAPFVVGTIRAQLTSYHAGPVARNP
jgi:hypothetical protein